MKKKIGIVSKCNDADYKLTIGKTVVMVDKVTERPWSRFVDRGQYQGNNPAKMETKIYCSHFV